MVPGKPTSRPRKRYGQHFLHDKSVIQRIIDLIIPVTTHPLLEIGPGRGALTFPLLQYVEHLDVIEIDKYLAKALMDKCDDPKKLTVHNSDVLKFDFRSHAAGRKFRVIGNLPYNISTPLLFHLLDQIDCIEEMIFMLQKEVAERICADTGTREYGRLSIMIQSLCRVESLFPVGPDAFTPAPRVESEVIRLIPLSADKSPLIDRILFSRIVRTAFSYRRKTLRNALKGLVDEDIFIELGIAPTSRPEQLTITDYTKIANALIEDKSE